MLTRYAKVHERKLNINLTSKGNSHPNTPSSSLVGVLVGSSLRFEREKITSVQKIVILIPGEHHIKGAEDIEYQSYFMHDMKHSLDAVVS